MSLPDYQTVAEILADVKALRPLGGSAYGHCAAMAFKLTALDERFQSGDALYAALDQAANQLLAEKPTMATIHNAKWLVVDKMREKGRPAGLSDLRQAICQRADLYNALSARAMLRLGEVGGNLIENGQTIMMHSFSRSLMSIFEQAHLAGKQFEVILTESRPLRESRHAMRQLTEWGIHITFVLDAAMAVVLPRADWCLAGADSIGIDGSVANKVGTQQLAILAAYYGKPLYIATEVMKLQRSTMTGYPIQLENRPANELLDVAAYEFPDRIQVKHQFFDLTPAVAIRSLITEQGILAPSAIGAAWNALESKFAQV